VGVLTALALVLGAAAVTKLRQPSAGGFSIGFVTVPARPLAVAELTLAVSVLVAPARVVGFVLAGVFAAFALAHARSWRLGGDEDCGCFGGAAPPRSSQRRLVLTAASAGAAGAAAAAGPPSLAVLASRSSTTAALLAACGAAVAAWVWQRVFLGPARPNWTSTGPSGNRLPISERLVQSSAAFLERRMSRRTMLIRLAAAGSALTVAPLRYLLYPGSALAAIGPGDCSGGLCTDGYTAFCCEINNGLNQCPGGTFPGGWWMCTDYTGGGLCAGDGVRYYVDCNQDPGDYQWSCQCAHDSCDYERVACNIFRYGQCNTQIAGTTAVVCRMIVCENPGSISGLNCGSSVAVDDNVCAQNAPCLEPAASQLPGAGGV
jgi:hypothetical protein